MLDFTPAHDQQSDAADGTDDEIYCAACGRSMTRGRWRIAPRDAHEHTVFNPAGQLFTILCFKEAPGAGTQGQSSSDFTWFPSYRWCVAASRGCAVHIGWRFEGTGVFFALIKPRLTAHKR
jgi:hypothetical protein